MEEIIKEIAELIDSGEIVYLHRDTHEILSYPQPDEYGYSEHEYLADEVLNIVEDHPDDYLHFEPLSSKEGFVMMESFVQTIKDQRLNFVLTDALNSRKPFRTFRNAVETEGIEDAWYDYKDAYLEMCVRDKL